MLLELGSQRGAVSFETGVFGLFFAARKGMYGGD